MSESLLPPKNGQTTLRYFNPPKHVLTNVSDNFKLKAKKRDIQVQTDKLTRLQFWFGVVWPILGLLLIVGYLFYMKRVGDGDLTTERIEYFVCHILSDTKTRLAIFSLVSTVMILKRRRTLRSIGNWFAGGTDSSVCLKLLHDSGFASRGNGLHIARYVYAFLGGFALQLLWAAYVEVVFMYINDYILPVDINVETCLDIE